MRISTSAATPSPLDFGAFPVPVWVYSVEANAFRWGNAEALSFWGVPDLQTFRGIDLSDLRPVTRARLQAAAARLESEPSCTDTWTIYHGGIPRSAICTLWAVDWGGERCLAVMKHPAASHAQENSLQARDQILSAVANSAERLLSGGSWAKERDNLLTVIGHGTGVHRSYFFRFDEEARAEGKWLASQEFEWCAEGVSPEIDNPDFQNFDMIANGFTRWIARFQQGLPLIAATPDQFTPEETAILAPQGIIAICAYPIIIDGMIEGFIGFDIVGTCRPDAPPAWSGHMIDALSMAAHLLAAARKMQHTQAQLSRALLKAREGSEAKSMFLANMSHELRTPLNAIIGFAQVIESELFGPIMPVEYSTYAADIRESGEHLLSLITDILDLEKALSGQLKLENQGVCLATDVINPAIKFLNGKAAQNGITLRVRHKSGNPAIQGDARKLLQIITNLISNAIKFSESDSTVTISTDIAPDDGVLIEVLDHGSGMTSDEIEEALTPFTQVGGHHERHREGTGLGLPIAKQLAESHGGSLEIQSTKGLGTRALIQLPAWRRIFAALETPKRDYPDMNQVAASRHA